MMVFKSRKISRLKTRCKVLKIGRVKGILNNNSLLLQRQRLKRLLYRSKMSLDKTRKLRTPNNSKVKTLIYLEMQRGSRRGTLGSLQQIVIWL